MGRIVAIALFLAAFAPVVQAGSISPVQKVISLIDDFAAKVQKDIDAAGKLFEEDAKFCDDEAVAKDHAIKGTNEEIESLSATIEDEKAKITQFATNIEDASGRISAAEGDLHKTAEEREKENTDFLGNEKQLLSTIGELEGAAANLKKSLSLAQMTPDAKRGLDSIVGALSNIVEASFVTHAQREKVQAFLQARADAEDDLTLATHSQGGSDSIIETLEQMTEKAEGTLSDERKAEMESNHAFMMVKQGMESEIKSTNEELRENTQGKAIATQALAQAEKDLGIAEKALASDTSYLADLKRDCQEKARTWEAEHKDGNAELKALSAAKAILTKKFSLIESKATLSSKLYDVDDPKARALRAIEELGRKFQSTALVALAYSAASDPFGKVRGMVEDMIAKLQREAAEEATQKAFCDEEMGKSTKSKDEKEGKLDKTNARIEKAEAAIAKLSEQIAVLSREVSEIDGAVKEATDLRQAENAGFRVAEKDFSESQEACASAIEVLREYYEGAAASLIQVGEAARRDGSGIIGLLEVAESDFAKLLADARTTEETSSTEFKKMMQENKLSKAMKETESKGKESEVKSLKSSLADYNQDSEGISSELDAVLQYLDELKPQCETKAPSYAEVKAKREQEIQGLKDALEILSADAVLIQTARHLRRVQA